MSVGLWWWSAQAFIFKQAGFISIVRGPRDRVGSTARQYLLADQVGRHFESAGITPMDHLIIPCAQKSIFSEFATPQWLDFLEVVEESLRVLNQRQRGDSEGDRER